MADYNPKDKFVKEMYRKAIHIASIIFPLLYIFLDYTTMLRLMVILLIVAFLIEYIRMTEHKFYPQFIKLITSKINLITRQHEERSLTGGSYTLIGMVITILFFSKFIFIAAFSVLAISDAVAALIGLRFGKIKLLDKTAEGCGAFLLSTILIVWFTAYCYQVNLALSDIIIGSIVVTIAEFIASKIRVDDNLIIPFAFIIYFGSAL